MKKISLILSFIVAMLFTCSVFATHALQQYSTSSHPVTANKLLSPGYKLTHVTVMNASKSAIYAVVPQSGGKVNDYLAPGKSGFITRSDLFEDWMYLEIQDINHQIIFGNTVFSKNNLVTVYGDTGSHHCAYSKN